MRVDTLTLVEGADIVNLTLASGTSDPGSPSVGELFYRTDLSAVRVSDGATWTTIGSGGGGSGTVTSVALSDASTSPIYNVTGSPVTSSGTLTVTLASQNANKVFAGPTTGSSAQPSFRTLVVADLPALVATGDATGTGSAGTGSIPLTLATVNSNTGSFGDASHVAGFTVNGKGLITAASSTAIAISSSAVSGLATSATTDTTNAANISSGTLPSGRLVGVYSGVTGLGTQAQALNMNSHLINNVSTPSSSTDAANKAYVDAVAAGITWKNSVKASTTANLSGTYVGTPTFTLTNNSTQAAFAVDGYSASSGDRILVKNQSTQSQNGIYVVTTVGSGSTNWVLTRATDFNEVTPVDEINGAAVYVQQGTLYTNTAWTQIDQVVTFDTDAIAWAQFSGASSGVSSLIAGTGISVDQATGAVTVTNTGVTSAVAGTGIGVSGATGAVTFSNTGVTAIAGTSNRVTLSGSTGSVSVDISSSYVGQATITTLGTVTTGTWNATTVTETHGGTAQSSYALGDTLYASATDTLSKLSGNTTSTKKYLSQTGNGTISAAPVWAQIAAADISGLATSATTDTTNASNISSGTLSGVRLPAFTHSGDATGTYNQANPGNVPLTLATVNSNTGSFGDASNSVTLTVNGKGLITAASSSAIAIAASAITSGTLAAARMPALTGDITTSAGAVATTLATVNSNTGSFGDASNIPVITVNGKGLVTAVSTIAVSAGSSFTDYIGYTYFGGL